MLIAVELEKVAVGIVEEYQPSDALVRLRRQDVGRELHAGVAEPLVDGIDIVDGECDVAHAAVGIDKALGGFGRARYLDELEREGAGPERPEAKPLGRETAAQRLFILNPAVEGGLDSQRPL